MFEDSSDQSKDPVRRYDLCNCQLPVPQIAVRGTNMCLRTASFFKRTDKDQAPAEAVQVYWPRTMRSRRKWLFREEFVWYECSRPRSGVFQLSIVTQVGVRSQR